MSSITQVSSALLGGALIGLSASILLACLGRVAGISGILDSVVEKPSRNLGWRIPFLLGLVTVGFALRGLAPHAFGAPVRGLVPLAAAGVLVGFGTRLANGCTSGHGISGISRLSPRSAVATATFIAAGMLTTYVLLHLRGGA